jgi:serralysin
MAKPIYTLSQIIDRIDSGGWWDDSRVTFSMPGSRPYAGDEGAGFTRLTSHMKSMANTAFELWDDAIDINLRRVSSGSDIFFGMSSTTDGNGTYSQQRYSTFADGRWVLDSAHVWLNSGWESHDQNRDIDWGTYGFMTYLHEIGHALGLDHPGEYNGSASYDDDAVYRQDTHRYTVMSYFLADEDGSRTDHFDRDGEWVYPATPMVHDIATMQAIYGADLSTRAGNTTYGFGSNAGRDVFDFQDNPDPIFTIWDGGGRDTLNASRFSTDQKIDLGEGEYSSIGHLTNNIAIAFGAVIEHAKGGRGDDRISGNSAVNKLWGKSGDDSITGGGGDDRLYGGAGNDWFNGGSGDDRIYGGGGTDIARFGGDRSDYTIRDRGSYVEIEGPGGSEVDRLYSIERVVFNDDTVVL